MQPIKELELIYENIALNDELHQQLGSLLFISNEYLSKIESLIENLEEKDSLSDSQEEKLSHYEDLKIEIESVITTIQQFNNIQPTQIKYSYKNIPNLLEQFLIFFEKSLEKLNPPQTQTLTQTNIQNPQLSQYQIDKENRTKLQNQIKQTHEIFAKLLQQHQGKVISEEVGWHHGDKSLLLQIQFPSPIGIIIFKHRFGYFGALNSRLDNYQEAIDYMKKLHKPQTHETIDPNELLKDNLSDLVSSLQSLINTIEY